MKIKIEIEKIKHIDLIVWTEYEYKFSQSLNFKIMN